MRRRDQMHSQVEEVMSVWTEPLGLTGGQARSEGAPLHHFTCCVVACGVLERARQDRGLTIDKLMRQLSCLGRTLELPALEQIRQAAQPPTPQKRLGAARGAVEGDAGLMRGLELDVVADHGLERKDRGQA